MARDQIDRNFRRTKILHICLVQLVLIHKHLGCLDSILCCARQSTELHPNQHHYLSEQTFRACHPPTGVPSVTSSAAAWSCRSLIFGNLGGGRLPAGDGLPPFGYDPGRLIPPTPPRERLPFDHGAKSGGEGSVAASGAIISLNPDPLTASSSLQRPYSVLRR